MLHFLSATFERSASSCDELFAQGVYEPSTYYLHLSGRPYPENLMCDFQGRFLQFVIIYKLLLFVIINNGYNNNKISQFTQSITMKSTINIK